MQQRQAFNAVADLNRVFFHSLHIPAFYGVFSVLVGYAISSNRQLHKIVLTFFDYSPWTKESVLQSQAGEVLMFLEALIQSPEDWRDGSVAKPECSGGKHIGGRGVRSCIISSIGSNVMFKRFWADNLWNIISHGYDL